MWQKAREINMNIKDKQSKLVEVMKKDPDLKKALQGYWGFKRNTNETID